MDILIFIPALNEEQTLGGLIDSLPKTLDKIEKIQILVVDDGSTDNTRQIAESKNVLVISHKKKSGVGKAFQTGLQQALELKTDILVTIDADNQFNPNDIEKIIKPIINKEADLVTGSRFIDSSKIPNNMPWIKKWGNFQIAKIISWATKQKLHDVSCGFRAYGKDAILNLNVFGKFTYTQETLLDLAYKGLSITEIPIIVTYFPDRKSRVAGSIMKYAINAGNIILRTVKDYKPLKFFGLCGIVIFLIGLAADIFVIGFFLKYNTFSPYKMLGFLGAFLNAVGIMIVFIGILADLIDKIRLTQEKILYLEKKKIYAKE